MQMQHAVLLCSLCQKIFIISKLHIILLHIKNKCEDKDYINASILKGNILTELKDYNQAILHYQKLLNIDSNIFHIYHHIATCYFKDGNFYSNDEVDIVSGNTTIKGKGLDVKKNGEYIKIKGKAKLKMLLSKKNAY